MWNTNTQFEQKKETYTIETVTGITRRVVERGVPEDRLQITLNRYCGKCDHINYWRD